MKRMCVFLVMMTGLLTHASDDDVSFDDSGWQQGPSEDWFVNWDKAVAESKNSGKPIFALSTGSDWCDGCVRLRENVLDKPAFVDFARKKLVLLYLDSPRENPLCEEQKRHNQEVSRKLSFGGGVPNAVVAAADGKKLGDIPGGELGIDAYLRKLGEIIGNSMEVKADGRAEDAGAVESKSQEPAAVPSAGCKLPSDLMPRTGLIADFDFSDSITNKIGSSCAMQFTDGRIVGGTLCFGGQYAYRVKNCKPEVAQIPLPDLNYDHFTVAMSFAAEGVDRGYAPLFVLCGGYRKLEINAACIDELVLRLDHKGLMRTDLKIVRGSWNWCICSVDAVGKRIAIGVNGKYFESELPDDFSWHFPTAKVKDRERNATLFTHLGLGTATKGFLDDLMVYNRTFSKQDFNDIFKGRRPEEVAAGKCLTARYPVWTEAIPLAKWLFRPYGERSLFWNGQMRSGNWTLDAHRIGDTLIVQPCYEFGSGILDLSKPVEDADGKQLRIVGIGYPEMVPIFSDWDRNNAAAEFILPETLEAVYGQAFAAGSFCGVTLPEGVRMIGKEAFLKCKNMRRIDIPKSAESIDKRAFKDCESLVSVNIRGTGVDIAPTAFCGTTPIARKMAELESLVGPVSVTVSAAAGVEDDGFAEHLVAGRLSFAEAMKLARAGDGSGYYALAVHCACGDETTRDPESAMSLLDRAIGKEDANAVFVRGLIEESQLEGSDLSGRRRSGGGANDAMESKSPFERYVGARIEDFAAHSVRKGSLANQADYDRVSAQYGKAANLGCAAAKMRLSHLRELRAKEMERIHNKEVKQ